MSVEMKILIVLGLQVLWIAYGIYCFTDKEPKPSPKWLAMTPQEQKDWHFTNVYMKYKDKGLSIPEMVGLSKTLRSML